MEYIIPLLVSDNHFPKITIDTIFSRNLIEFTCYNAKGDIMGVLHCVLQSLTVPP